ncbi:MAG: Flp pilus assembly complex ATPase component TadA [Bdellovibrionaceae bacterium]|nr:Flp pilus assembly complex ATPase component TadA [Pseudobdellovibrionaceae bacterium]NUM58828.1 CpaF family protein [Pseudobdellovibrionaceae bacterium]
MNDTLEIDKAFITQQIIGKINALSYEEFALGNTDHQKRMQNRLDQIINEETSHLSTHEKNRIANEFHGLGPLEDLFQKTNVTEIIVNSPNKIFFEENGKLNKHEDSFYSDFTFDLFIQRISDKINLSLSLEQPFCDGSFANFRVSLVDKSITKDHTSVNFRKHPIHSWDFEKLILSDWCSKEVYYNFKSLIDDNKNFLIIGPTGSGKTSVLNSCLQLTAATERSLIIEDTSEIILPNDASIKLLTKHDPHGIQKEITQNDLVRRALRLRPDRIIMGEIRSSEAKDFLMALSTGHLGSFATLHASDPHQALIRLEMLIQIGAPQWNLLAIRRLIALSLNYIIVVGKDDSGKRKFKGAFELNSLEEHGFLIERKF